MHALTLYGTQEDRIRIEGEFEEEVDAYDLEDGAYLAISDGTLLTMAVDDDGVWRIGAVTLGSNTTLEKAEGILDSETESDRVTLTNPGVPFRWALIGSNLVSAAEWPEGETT